VHLMPIQVTMLAGRTRIFCCEKEVIEQLRNAPRDVFVARDGLNAIDDLGKYVDENPHGFFSFSLRLKGGKGGFGTLLKSFRINKSSNQLMCRDLSGRRLADVEEEKKLKKWVETTGDREKEKETKQKVKHEKLRAATRDKPKHDFNDPDYIRTREDILEKTDDAFEDGFKNLKKRKPVVVEEEESSDEEDDQPGTSAATFRKAKRERVMFAEESSSSSPDSKEEEKGGSEEKEDEKIHDYRTPDEQPVAPAPPPVVVVEAPKKEEKKPYEKPKDIPTDFPLVELQECAGVDELEALGLYHLKHALEARGLKCGGSLQERAARLFSVKGLKKEDYPKAIVAPPAKNKK
ncbi:hypothetical protein PENTCL1PPCAC_1121, partial [Pristionchus entomophagus]